MIYFTTVAAGKTAGDAGDQRVVVDLHFDHGVQRLTVFGKQIAQRVSLGQRAREAVENETALGVAFQLFFGSGRSRSRP